MKTRFTNIVCGLTTASIFALALTGCDDNSLIAPTNGDMNSSAMESLDTSSSSNGDVPPESSNGTPTSSETPASSANEPVSSGNDVSSSSTEKRCEAFLPECGYSEEELCGMGYTEYCASSSSTINEISSSSKVSSSSSSTIIEVSSSSKIASSSSLTLEACIDMDQMCPPCVEIGGEKACPLTNEPCGQCNNEGVTAKSCKGGLGYVCSDGLWKQIMGEPTC